MVITANYKFVTNAKCSSLIGKINMEHNYVDSASSDIELVIV